MKPRSSIRRPLSMVTLATALLTAWPGMLPAAAGNPLLQQAEALLERGQADRALAILEPMLKQGPPNAEALLLRSTARIMTGDTRGGFKDLERAVKVDPGLRQGWLNLAGMEIAEGRYQAARKALGKAQELDPAASDSYLNLGAVAVLEHQLDEAARHFATYLERELSSAEAYYLVATNYAVGGYEERAVAHLRHAIETDERMRMRARTDGRFAALAGPEYRALLNTDSYVLPPGAHTVAAAFKEPYTRREPRLLYAVIDALKQLGEPYDPTVEANQSWAIVWAEMRIKLFNQENGTGVVSLSAPAERFTADEWERRSQQLFRAIYQELENDELTLGALGNR